MLFQVCYAALMTTKTDALIHLPVVNVGPWKRLMGCHERCVIFKCEHGNYRHAVLTVYGAGEGASLIFVRLDGVVRELWVGECADPFSVANETLVAFARDCNCHIELNGESL